VDRQQARVRHRPVLRLYKEYSRLGERRDIYGLKKRTASKIMWEVSSIVVRSSRSCLSVCLFVYIGRSVCLCVNILNRSIGGVGQVYNVVSFLPVCVRKRPTLSFPKIRMHTTVLFSLFLPIMYSLLLKSKGQENHTMH